MSELVRTQQLLMCIKEQVRSDLIEEFADETRFATNALRLGTNRKCSVMPKPGDVVQLRTQNTFEVGVLTRLLRGRHAEVRLSSGRVVETSAGNLSLIAMGDVEILETVEEKNPRNFTHFVSVDLFPEENLNHEGCPRGDALPCISPVQEYQAMLEDVRGIGSPMQKNKMHITMAILTVLEGGLEEVKDLITSAMQEFKDMLSHEVFYVGMSGIGMFSTPCNEKHVVSEVKFGRHALALMRASLFEQLGDYISDRAFRSSEHATGYPLVCIRSLA